MLILLLPIAVYLIDRAVNHGEVPRNVSIVGIDVGGLSRGDAAEVVRAYETDLKSRNAAFVVSGSTFELDPMSVGWSANVDGAVEAAMNYRSGGLVDGFAPWVRGFTEDADIDLAVSIDEDAVRRFLGEWELDAIENPAYEGEIEIVDGGIDFEYPRIGQRLDMPGAESVVDAVLADPDRAATELPLTDSLPELAVADIDDAVLTLRRMVSTPILLHDGEQNRVLTVKPSEIRDATIVEIDRKSPVRIDISLDAGRVAEILDPHRPAFDVSPVNVDFDIDIGTDEVTIIPSKNGIALDPEAAVAELFNASTAGEAAAKLVFGEGEEAEYTTEDAEAFGPLGLVYDFTTDTPGVNRVHNIHLMADTIDGYVVWPGEEFSINEVVGQRTKAKGYLEDCAIINGEFVCEGTATNVGGGVSQYATTIYNAIFFGCYEDVAHAPHSVYIRRYPEGREATLGYPAPDVRFRNDTDAPVIIRNTYYGKHSITVKFYGNNGGRSCKAERSGRFNFTPPREVHKTNPDLPRGTTRVTQNGSEGWSITVTRVMTMPDGTVIREPYTHHYRGAARVTETNP